jgi:membrane protein YqaA with SNARE-associated domain
LYGGGAMDLIAILLNAIEDPYLYSVLFLIYVILAAVILPIPVEIGLFNPNLHPLILILILAVGKGIGAFFVFYIGSGVRKGLTRWKMKSKTIKQFITYCELFVKKYGLYGLLIIMSIPLMIDSVSLYFFSLLNPKQDGKKALSATKFVIINIAAGAIRGSIILAVALFLGVRLI